MIALNCVRQLGALACLLSLIGCSNGRGSLDNAEAAPTGFTVGGTVSGLTGAGLVLQNNGGSDLTVSANGAYAFAASLADGTSYNVTVLSQPSNPAQICAVANGGGSIAGSNVTSIGVTCAAGTFAVGGTVTGLLGSGLVLQNNGGDDLAVAADGSFRFAAPLATGAGYAITVRTQPANPSQTCTIANATGAVGSVDVTNIAVTCVTGAFSIGGAVSGLVGSGLVLQNNGGDDLAIAASGTANGSFAFPQAVPSGTPYVVSVKTQPSNPSQTCAVANATGVVAGGNVTNVTVSCTTSVFTIGGTVTGLRGAGLVLQLNGGGDLEIASNGSFTFDKEQASGTPFQVTVRTQPVGPSQTCTVADGSATVGGGNVRNVKVSCATDTFAIGGAVSGLLGAGLVLQNNGGDDISVDSSGAFTFPTEVASAAAYNVTVRTQPANPTQACTVTNGTGTVGGANITNAAVSCTTSEFTIGGTAGGLAGSGLLLRNNGTDDLQVSTDGSFTFATSLQSGSPYNIAIAAQPTNPTQTCTLSNASGTVGSANVTNVTLSCVTVEFTVGGTVSGLLGFGLVLQNNGSDNLAIAANGAFTFPASLPSGTQYNVAVAGQPVVPVQACAVTNGSGTVGSANVADVAVICITIGF